MIGKPFASIQQWGGMHSKAAQGMQTLLYLDLLNDFSEIQAAKLKHNTIQNPTDARCLLQSLLSQKQRWDKTGHLLMLAEEI